MLGPCLAGPTQPNQSLAPFHEIGISGAYVGWMCDLKPAVFPVHEYWLDVGHPSDLDDADAFHRERTEGK